MEKLKNGMYYLSGIEDFSYDNGWGDIIEGIRIVLNNEVYEVFYDPDDGYRSYGVIHKSDFPIRQVRMRFVPQLIYVQFVNGDDVKDCQNADEYEGYRLYDANNGKLILEIGTYWMDFYYPCGNYHYHPENLSINEGK